MLDASLVGWAWGWQPNRALIRQRLAGILGNTTHPWGGATSQHMTLSPIGHCRLQSGAHECLCEAPETTPRSWVPITTKTLDEFRPEAEKRPGAIHPQPHHQGHPARGKLHCRAHALGAMRPSAPRPLARDGHDSVSRQIVWGGPLARDTPGRKTRGSSIEAVWRLMTQAMVGRTHERCNPIPHTNDLVGQGSKATSDMRCCLSAAHPRPSPPFWHHGPYAQQADAPKTTHAVARLAKVQAARRKLSTDTGRRKPIDAPPPPPHGTSHSPMPPCNESPRTGRMIVGAGSAITAKTRLECALIAQSTDSGLHASGAEDGP